MRCARPAIGGCAGRRRAGGRRACAAGRRAAARNLSQWIATLPPAARDRLRPRVGGHFGPVILSGSAAPALGTSRPQSDRNTMRSSPAWQAASAVPLETDAATIVMASHRIAGAATLSETVDRPLEMQMTTNFPTKRAAGATIAGLLALKKFDQA